MKSDAIVSSETKIQLDNTLCRANAVKLPVAHQLQLRWTKELVITLERRNDCLNTYSGVLRK